MIARAALAMLLATIALQAADRVIAGYVQCRALGCLPRGGA